MTLLSGPNLSGNEWKYVKVGKRAFIGANSVLKQGISIGEDVTVGPGSVVIRDIPDGECDSCWESSKSHK